MWVCTSVMFLAEYTNSKTSFEDHLFFKVIFTIKRGERLATQLNGLYDITVSSCRGPHPHPPEWNALTFFGKIGKIYGSPLQVSSSLWEILDPPLDINGTWLHNFGCKREGTAQWINSPREVSLNWYKPVLVMDANSYFVEILSFWYSCSSKSYVVLMLVDCCEML